MSGWRGWKDVPLLAAMVAGLAVWCFLMFVLSIPGLKAIGWL